MWLLNMNKMSNANSKIALTGGSIRPAEAHADKARRPESKGLNLEMDIASDIGTIRSDQRRVEQILLNLIGNAVKFTEKGYVKITAEIGKKESDKNIIWQVNS